MLCSTLVVVVTALIWTYLQIPGSPNVVAVLVVLLVVLVATVVMVGDYFVVLYSVVQ